MARFTAAEEQREGERLWALRDAETGASAQVWPGFGNNVVDAWLPAPAGGTSRAVHALLGPGRLEQVREQPSWWGIPLLYPWASGIPQGRFTFRGREYDVNGYDANGGTGHGVVKNRPWRVVDSGADGEGAWVTSAIQTADFPEVQARFPFPSRLTVTYRLGAAGLTMVARVENSGEGPLPFSFGAHPYFRVPLAGEDPDHLDGHELERAACTVCVPAHRRWQANRLATVPAGQRVALDDVSAPVSDDLDLRRPRRLEDRHFNGVCAQLDAVDADGNVEAYVADPGPRVELVMRASRTLPFVVVWSPPGRPGLCLEPWTAPPDAFNLAARGLPAEESGLVVLEQGQTWEGTMRLYARHAR